MAAWACPGNSVAQSTGGWGCSRRGRARAKTCCSLGQWPEIICKARKGAPRWPVTQISSSGRARLRSKAWATGRSEEHTSELQSRGHLVCRLLLEKKKKNED